MVNIEFHIMLKYRTVVQFVEFAEFESNSNCRKMNRKDEFNLQETVSFLLFFQEFTLLLLK